MDPKDIRPARPALRAPRGSGVDTGFRGPALGQAFASSIALHGALALGAVVWTGGAFLRYADDAPVPTVRFAPVEVVAVVEEVPPVELQPERVVEPELRPVFEEEPDLLPIDWMDRPSRLPRHEDLVAVVRVEPPPPEPVAEPQLEEPEPADDPPATVTAVPASRVEASYDPDPELSPPPRYPRLARRRGWEGVVLLEATVGPDGRLLALVVVHSSGYQVLDEAALETVRDWKPGAFRPAVEGDRPVEGVVPIQFRFQIEDEGR